MDASTQSNPLNIQPSNRYPGVWGDHLCMPSENRLMNGRRPQSDHNILGSVLQHVKSLQNQSSHNSGNDTNELTHAALNLTNITPNPLLNFQPIHHPATGSFLSQAHVSTTTLLWKCIWNINCLKLLAAFYSSMIHVLHNSPILLSPNTHLVRIQENM